MFKDHNFIYSNQTNEFQRFSACEDYNHNLRNYITKNFNWENISVLEAGAGMGRITDFYINKAKKISLTDSSNAMLEYCRSKYLPIKNKVFFYLCKHNELPFKFQNYSFDTFISAYSLSYEAIKHKKISLQNYINSILSLNINKYIIIENIGIFSSTDFYIQPYQDYFDILSYYFNKAVIPTDYFFKSNQEAIYYCDLFFGKSISTKIKRTGNNIVPELTCVWYN